MASESERPIEKLLRTWANKRRGDAGAPLELHPVNRRQLQEEVARRLGTSTGKSSGWLANLWPRLAWSAGGLALVALAVFLLAPALFPAKSKSHFAVADKDLRQNITPSPKVELVVNNGKNSLGVSNLQSPPESLLVASKAEPPAETPNLKTASAAPAAQLAANETLMERAKAANEPVVAPQRSLDATQGPETALRMRYGLAPGAPRDRAQQTDLAKQAAQQNFYRTMPPAGVVGALDAKKSPASPVLADFEVEQSGATLRIKDADGSVYDGFVQNVVNRSAAVSGQSLGGVAARSVTLARAANQLADTAGTTWAAQAGSNYFFRVAGTNQTLNQQVVFTGNLFYPPAFPLSSTSSVPASASAGIVVIPQSNAVLNSFISGKAVLNGQKELEINAVQSKP